MQNFFRISKGSLGIGELSIGSLRFQDDDDDEPEGVPGLLAQQQLLALLPRIQLEVHDIAGDKQNETIDFLMLRLLKCLITEKIPVFHQILNIT